jgi:uncharacterized protein YbaR (Trm112 family)
MKRNGSRNDEGHEEKSRNREDLLVELFCEVWEVDACYISKGGTMAIDDKLLELLVCPKCKGDIYLNGEQNGLVCEACRLVYEIRDDIPIMLIEEAKPLGNAASPQ